MRGAVPVHGRRPAARDTAAPYGTIPAVRLLLALVPVVLGPGLAPTAQAATCDDSSTRAAAQRAADTRDPDGDGIYCENLPCPCSRAAGGQERLDASPRPRRQARSLQVVGSAHEEGRLQPARGRCPTPAARLERSTHEPSGPWSAAAATRPRSAMSPRRCAPVREPGLTATRDGAPSKPAVRGIAPSAPRDACTLRCSSRRRRPSPPSSSRRTTRPSRGPHSERSSTGRSGSRWWTDPI